MQSPDDKCDELVSLVITLLPDGLNQRGSSDSLEFEFNVFAGISSDGG
jgi:hypothetical protein